MKPHHIYKANDSKQISLVQTLLVKFLSVSGRDNAALGD